MVMDTAPALISNEDELDSLAGTTMHTIVTYRLVISAV